MSGGGDGDGERPWDEAEKALAAEVAKRAAAEALDTAADAAEGVLDRLKAAIAGEADSVLTGAERRLQEEHDLRAGKVERLEEAGRKVRQERLARKERALAELERLKAARGDGAPRASSPSTEPATRTGEEEAASEGEAADTFTAPPPKRTL